MGNRGLEHSADPEEIDDVEEYLNERIPALGDKELPGLWLDGRDPWMGSHAVLLLLLVTMAAAVIGWRVMKRGKSQKSVSDKQKK